MIKIIRRIILVALLTFLGALIVLVPSSVNKSDQLKNIEGTTSWTNVIEPALSNANLTSKGLSTEVTLNNVQLNQILKSSLTDTSNQKLLDNAYSISDDKLRIQSPVKIGFIDSKIDLDFDVTAQDNILYAEISNAKIGKFPIPKSIVKNILKEQLKQDDSITVEGDKLLFKLPQSQFTIDKVNIENENIKVQFQMSLNF